MEQQGLIFQFDDVEVDVRNAQVFKAGQRVSVEPKAFRVLVFLLERPGRLVEKEELLSAVWADTFVTENALTRSIALLRKSLGESKEHAKYIETVPTRGYRFIATVTVRTAASGEASGGGEMNTSRMLPSPPIENHRRFAWPALAIVALVLVAAAFLAAKLRSHKEEAEAQAESSPDFPSLQVSNSTGLDIFPTFSPDGNTVAYSSNQTGAFEIYLKQLTPGGSLVKLTDDGGMNTQPAWSPDGTTIAYFSQIKGGIWLVPALGGVARQLTNFGSSPAWSPDGAQIVFSSDGIAIFAENANGSLSGATLWTVSVRDGSTRQLTQLNHPDGSHNTPDWSPDGKSVLFASAGLRGPALWTVTVADGQLHKVTNGRVSNAVYAPDGNHAYFSSEFALWKMPLDKPLDTTGRARRTRLLNTLPEYARYLALSADGKKLAFSRLRTSSNIYALRMAGDRPVGEPAPLTNDTRLRKTNPAVSFNGRQVLFEVGSVDKNGGVWVMDANGKNSRPVLAPCEDARWLPGDQDIICQQYVEDVRPGCVEPKCFTEDLVKVHLATGAHETLGHVDHDGAFFAYSRDGKQAAFMSSQNGSPNTWVTSLDGSPPRQITFDPISMGFPSWSPDGQLLALEQKVPNGANIWTVKPGEAPVQLTHDPGLNWSGSFSPDGEKIVFAAERNGVWNLWWISRRDGSEKQLTFYRNANEYVRYPDWSPSGKVIDYEYAETTGNIWLLEFR